VICRDKVHPQCSGEVVEGGDGVEDMVGRGTFAAALAEERLLLVGAALRTNLAMKIMPDPAGSG
jgi:hypothetical protein